MGFEASMMAKGNPFPQSWKVTSVGEVADINKVTISANNLPKWIEYIDISSVGERRMDTPVPMECSKAPSRARRKVSCGDILISTVRPNLKHFIYLKNTNQNWIASTGFAVVSPKPIVDSLYLYYYLTSDIFTEYLTRVADGGAYPAFNPSEIQNAELLFPPLPEQKAIARILSSLDDKIELNQQMNRTLEAQARAIFKSWFVDFDPVRAKMEGRQPVGMDAATAALFPDAFEESELGMIPKGWKITNLAKVIDIYDSKRVPLSAREREKRRGIYPYYGAAALMDYVDDFLFDGIYILVGEDGSVLDDNDRPVIQYVWGKFWVNNHAHVLQGANGISSEHLMLFLQQTNISPYVNGAVQLKLNQSNLFRIPFLLPDNKISNEFNRKILHLYKLYRFNTEQSKNLTNLRDFLLPKLMSGEIRVKDAEKMLEEVA